MKPGPSNLAIRVLDSHLYPIFWLIARMRALGRYMYSPTPKHFSIIAVSLVD